MQLLKITNIPIKIKISKENPQLQMNQEQAKVKMETKPGKLSLQKRDIQVRIDTYQARKSLGYMTPRDSGKAAAQRGAESVQAAMAEYAELGNRLAQAHKGVDIPDAAYSKLVKEPSTQMVFLPAVGAQLSWEGGTVDVNYDPAQVSTEWDTGSADIDYVPGNLEFEIEQYPDIQIEYLGSPTYVPKSANPEYKESEGK